MNLLIFLILKKNTQMLTNFNEKHLLHDVLRESYVALARFRAINF